MSTEETPAPTPPPAVELGPMEEFQKLQTTEVSTLSRTFNAYAGPNVWGPWVQIAAHGGSVGYSISYEAVGSTLVIGAVYYYGSGGWVTQQFRDSISIRTGNVWATVHVCFRGTPFGSAVRGIIR